MTKKIIVITGSSGCLGEVLVKHLSSDYIVIGLSHDDCDVTEKLSIRYNIIEVLARYKKIDVLINNAGIMCFNPIEKVTEADINISLDVNFKGAVNMIQEVLPIMKRNDFGRIINISSIRGITGCPNKSVYTASKFALQGFSDSLRHELTDFNIKITNICPGKFHQSVELLDIVNSVKYILNLSDKTCVRNIILGGQL